jgi:CRP-like cAMP-binding protein
MPGHNTSRLSRETHFAFREGRRAAFEPDAPRNNHLLAALPLEDYKRVRPHLVATPLPLGSTMYDADERESYLYFLTEGVVCRMCVLENGASAEFAVTGNEGVIGVASFLGGESTVSRTVVVSAGHAYRIKAAALKSQFEYGGPFQRLLLRYTQALITQTAQAAVCNRHHSLDQRLCRWILSYLDRVSLNELTITQELIANMLGVRREGITEAAGKLQTAGMIQHHRGHIAVLDRRGLEARVCECYAVVKRECDRLLHTDNIADNVEVHGASRESRSVNEGLALNLTLPLTLTPDHRFLHRSVACE